MTTPHKSWYFAIVQIPSWRLPDTQFLTRCQPTSFHPGEKTSQYDYHWEAAMVWQEEKKEDRRGIFSKNKNYLCSYRQRARMAEARKANGEEEQVSWNLQNICEIIPLEFWTDLNQMAFKISTKSKLNNIIKIWRLELFINNKNLIF